MRNLDDIKRCYKCSELSTKELKLFTGGRTGDFAYWVGYVMDCLAKGSPYGGGLSRLFK